jgi:hypothetical protein
MMDPTTSTGQQAAPTPAEEASAGSFSGLERPRLDRPPFVARWMLIALAIVAGVALVVVGIVIAVNMLTARTVPDLMKLKLDAARARATAAGFELVVAERRFSTTASGTVLSQDPVPGTSLRRGRAVSVVVSSGGEEFAMPDVVGNGLAVARRLLEAKGLDLRVETAASDQPTDTVLSTNPAPGVKVRTGDVVRVTVSSAGGGSAILLPFDMKDIVVLVDAAPVPSGQIDVPLEVVRRLRSLVEASGGTLGQTRSTNDTGVATQAPARAMRVGEASASVAVGLNVAQRGSGGVVASSLSVGAPAVVASSAALASSIATALTDAGTPAKTAVVAGDPVLGATTAPWASLQLGSYSSREDVATFRDPAWADGVARAIYRGIAQSLGLKQRAP